MADARPLSARLRLRQEYVDRLRQDAINHAAGGPLPEPYVRKVAESVVRDVGEALREADDLDATVRYYVAAWVEREFGRKL